VSIKASRTAETMLKQTLNPFLVFSKGEDAVSNISGGEHIQLGSQTT